MKNKKRMRNFKEFRDLKTRIRTKQITLPGLNKKKTSVLRVLEKSKPGAVIRSAPENNRASMP